MAQSKVLVYKFQVNSMQLESITFMCIVMSMILYDNVWYACRWWLWAIYDTVYLISVVYGYILVWVGAISDSSTLNNVYLYIIPGTTYYCIIYNINMKYLCLWYSISYCTKYEHAAALRNTVWCAGTIHCTNSKHSTTIFPIQQDLVQSPELTVWQASCHNKVYIYN